MKKYRKEKFNEQFKRVISELLFREIKDPRIKGFITITEVDIAKDFKSARVYYTIYGTSKKEKEKSMKGIICSANYIEHRLFKDLSLKYRPKLTFIYDESIKKGFDIIQKLNQLKQEEKQNDQ